LRIGKIDKKDYFAQLIATGNDLVGSVTVKALEDE
jgi:serine/threonine-protein kinase HipA